MRLVNVSRYFDDVLIRDAYTNLYVFSGQVAAFIDTQVDGTISRRRILSLAPSLTIPARRVVKYLNEVWLIGDGITDGLQGVALRVTYASKRSVELYSIKTPAQAALNLAGTLAYGQSDYLKSTVNSPTDSEYDGQYEIYFTSAESISQGTFLTLGNRVFHTRGVHTVLDGFVVSEADELDPACAVTATFTDNGTYNPVTDTQAGTTVVTTGLLLDMYKLYAYKTQADTLNAAGDMTLIVAQSAVTPAIGQLVSAGGNWRIQGVLPYADAWNLHLRRA